MQWLCYNYLQLHYLIKYKIYTYSLADLYSSIKLYTNPHGLKYDSKFMCAFLWINPLLLFGAPLWTKHRSFPICLTIFISSANQIEGTYCHTNIVIKTLHKTPLCLGNYNVQCPHNNTRNSSLSKRLTVHNPITTPQLVSKKKSPCPRIRAVIW